MGKTAYSNFHYLCVALKEITDMFEASARILSNWKSFLTADFKTCCDNLRVLVLMPRIQPRPKKKKKKSVMTFVLLE